jgi:hypothetical protein
MKDITVNRFRAARGRIIRAQIETLADLFGRDIEVLDVGGRPEYWSNVGLGRISKITILNYDKRELNRSLPSNIFRSEFGDARNLSAYEDQAVDLVHSNSVIEHVGSWTDMSAMARELRRVGRSGWVQTPAWEFPIEPHFRAPFLHWFAQPIRRRLLWMSKPYRTLGIPEKRWHIDRINLLSRAEVKALFPDCELYVERLLFPKSFAARWAPDGMQLRHRAF